MSNIGDIEPQQEHCICAAVRMPEGEIIRGRRHDNCIRLAVGLGYNRLEIANMTQGFLTNTNRFVDRKEGMQIQKASGFPSKYTPDGKYHADELFSEDLY